LSPYQPHQHWSQSGHHTYCHQTSN
jgi:hypothetical protein